MAAQNFLTFGQFVVSRNLNSAQISLRCASEMRKGWNGTGKKNSQKPARDSEIYFNLHFFANRFKLKMLFLTNSASQNKPNIPTSSQFIIKLCKNKCADGVRKADLASIHKIRSTSKNKFIYLETRLLFFFTDSILRP